MGCLLSKTKIIYIWEDIELTRRNINNMFFDNEDSKSEPDIRNYQYYYGNDNEIR